MGEWVDIPLALGQAEESASSVSYVSDAELTNLMFKENPPGSRTPFHIASTPALNSTGFPAMPGSGKIRGICNKVGGTVAPFWMIQGTTIYYTPDFSAWAAVGTMPGTAYCRMVDTGTHIVVTDGTNTRAFTAFPTTDTPSIEGHIDVAYQDGYTLYAKNGSNKLYASNVDDPITVGALSYTTVDALPGNIVGVASLNRELFVFKENSIEHFYNAGGAGFPFVRGSPGLIERGAWSVTPRLGVQTIAKGYGSIFWLGDDLRVYMMQGYQPVPISSAWVERFLNSNIFLTNPSGAEATIFGNVFMLGGVLYYMLSGFVEGTTSVALVCDVKNQLWHKRTSPIASDLRLQFGATFTSFYFYGSTLHTAGDDDRFIITAEDESSGAASIYFMDIDGTNDSGASGQTNRVMTLPQFAPNGGGGGRVEMAEVEIDMQKPSTTGTITLNWSDNGGTSYTTGQTNTGANARTRFQRLGSFYQRIVRLTFSIASKLAIMGVRARIDVGSA